MYPTVTGQQAEVQTLEKKIGHRFGRRQWLEQALTHSSQAREAEASRPGGERRGRVTAAGALALRDSTGSNEFSVADGSTPQIRRFSSSRFPARL